MTVGVGLYEVDVRLGVGDEIEAVFEVGVDGESGTGVSVDSAGTEKLVVDLERELGVGIGSGSLEEGEGGLEMRVTTKASNALLFLVEVLVNCGATAATKTSFCATDGFVILEVAIGEGADESSVGAEAGTDELGGIGSSLWSEVLRALG